MDDPALTFDGAFRRLIAGCKLNVTIEEQNQRDEFAAIDAQLGIRQRGRPGRRRSD